MRGGWSILLVAMLVAGCSEADPAIEEKTEDYDEFALDETPEQLGVIRGVVVDMAVQPLAGASVSLVGRDDNTTTKESGAFAFKDLEPGAYFITVAKPGYKETQTSTEVTAGVREPPVVKVLLERLPGTEPDIQDDLFQGYITCSIRIPAAGFNDGCGVYGDLGLGSTQRKDIGFGEGNVAWIQTEQAWKPSSDTAERLCSGAGEMTPSGTVCGPSPIVRYMDQGQVEARDLHKGETFEYVVYPDHLVADVSGNIVLEQAFEVVTHAFYNFVPPEGWEFGRDGLPPVPA